MNLIEKQIQDLKSLAECAKVTLDEVFGNDISMEKAKKTLENIIIENHTNQIFYSQSDGTWRTYIPDGNCKSKRKLLKRKSKENLEKAIVVYYKEKEQRESRDNLTLEGAYREWVIYRRDHTAASNSTIRKNDCDWNRFFSNTEISRMRLGDITPVVIRKFFRDLTKDREYTYKCIGGARSVISGILSYAVENELLPHNPALDVDFKKFSYKPVPNQADNVFSTEETRKLLLYLETVIEPYSLAIQLSFNLFVRIGEMKALKWEDIDFQNRTIYIRRQVLDDRAVMDDLSFAQNDIQVCDYIKGYTANGYRKQYLTDRAIELLRLAKQLNPEGDFIFMPQGKLMSTSCFNKHLKCYCKCAEIPYRSSHKIRFYNASTAYDGTNLVAISRMMGHNQTATTIHYLRDVMHNEGIKDVFRNLGLK